MASKIPTFQSDLKCKECGTVIAIQRVKHRPKEYGHIKHLYCYKCRDTTAHIELGNNEEYGWRDGGAVYE